MTLHDQPALSATSFAYVREHELKQVFKEWIDEGGTELFYKCARNLLGREKLDEILGCTGDSCYCYADCKPR